MVNPWKTPTSVHGALLVGTLRALITLAAGALGFVAMSLTDVQFVVMPNEHHEDIRILPAEDPARVLADKYGCWTGEVPDDMKGKIPGHVIVTLPNGDLAYGGDRLVGRALVHVFERKEEGLHVHAFCR